MKQESLPGLVAKRAHRIHDFLDLFPGNVFPTSEIFMLERDKNILVIKSYNHGVKVARAQDRIWKLLVRFGEVVDAPGHVTVICVWGLGANVVREWVTYDATGTHERAGSIEDFRKELARWWHDARRAR